MVRERNPERTRQKILDVSRELFLEKGYDDTSIQDIIDGLGGMTKGVIYHHFSSKFEIFETIMASSSSSTLKFEGETGFEKLQNGIKISFEDFDKQAIGYSATVTLRSPRILGEQYLMIFDEIVPELKKIVDAGVEDGSIKTDFPEEITELMMLTLNLWIGFRFAILSEEELNRKMLFCKKMFEGLGVPLIDEEILEETKLLFRKLKKE